LERRQLRPGGIGGDFGVRPTGQCHTNCARKAAKALCPLRVGCARNKKRPAKVNICAPLDSPPPLDWIQRRWRGLTHPPPTLTLYGRSDLFDGTFVMALLSFRDSIPRAERLKWQRSFNDRAVRKNTRPGEAR
jgi:hypothetical protein